METLSSARKVLVLGVVLGILALTCLGFAFLAAGSSSPAKIEGPWCNGTLIDPPAGKSWCARP